MRKRRRIEIQIEHREIFIYSTHAPSIAQSLPSTAPETALIPASHPACPTCGSPKLVLLADAVAQPRFDVAALNLGMQQGRIHHHRSPSGEWWLCSTSLQG